MAQWMWKRCSFLSRETYLENYLWQIWWFLQIHFLEWRVVFRQILEDEVFKYCCLIIFLFFFPFALFLPPRVKQTIFPEIAIKTVLADTSTVAERLAGYLSQAACTWLCWCYQQGLWADAVVWVGWPGWCLLKYHGQGPLQTCPDHPCVDLWDFHQGDFICLEVFFHVGSSAQPWPFCKHQYLRFFITWYFWNSYFFLWVHVTKFLVFHSMYNCTPFPPNWQ